MRHLHRPLGLVVLFLSVGAVLFASSAEQDGAALFNKANSCYEKGEFQQAADCYAGILRMGLESGQVYYNIGNAYFKLGDLGKAILYYEKAMDLMPQDADLKSNLEYARSLVEESSPTVSKAWWVKHLEGLTGALNLDNLTIALSTLYILVVCLAALNTVYRQRMGRKLSLVIAAAVLITVSLAASFAVRIYEEEFLKPAIVTQKEADCRFEPLDESTSYFKVRAGNKVFVVNSKDDWFKVRRLDGKAAWVKKDAISLI
jgi:tetratricopeptide (TPR) repeat protein